MCQKVCCDSADTPGTGTKACTGLPAPDPIGAPDGVDKIPPGRKGAGEGRRMGLLEGDR